MMKSCVEILFYNFHEYYFFQEELNLQRADLAISDCEFLIKSVITSHGQAKMQIDIRFQDASVRQSICGIMFRGISQLICVR